MRYQRSRGFTLVELLVVIAIIGILVALLLPAIQAAREAARRSQCTNNMKQLGLAIQVYHDTYKMFPPGAVRPYYGTGTCSYPAALSWIARVLPGLEQQPLYDQIDWEVVGFFTAGSLNTTVVAPTKLAAVRCPSDNGQPVSTSYGPNNYVGCSGSDGSSWPSTSTAIGLMREATSCNSSTVTGQSSSACNNCAGSNWCNMAKVSDGTANTMAISECLVGKPYNYNTTTSGDLATCNAGTLATPPTGSTDPRGQSWMRAVWSANWAYTAFYPPNDELHARYECYSYSSGNYYGARSLHPGGVNVCFVDGATRFVAGNIDLATWRAIATIGGSETIPSF